MAASDNPLDLTGRVLLVTGAGQGVGRRVAQLAAARGAAVAVNDFSAERAGEVVEELRAAGAKATAAVADVGDFDTVGAVVAQVAEELGPIDILVNNAGNRGAETPTHMPRPFWEQDPSDWEPFTHVNLDGVMVATRHAFPHMMGKKYGRVITVISDAGRVGEINGMEAYSGAKAGAAGFTRSMARLGGRFGEPDDAANMILFLASDVASWITGQTIPVNGGYSLTL